MVFFEFGNLMILNFKKNLVIKYDHEVKFYLKYSKCPLIKISIFFYFTIKL